MERRVLFECVTGSHLFGTSTPESDEDFVGVYMSSTKDVFGLGKIPDEWDLSVKKSTGERNTKEDVDRKYYSVKRFCTLAGQGQATFLEMFFVPKDKIISTSPEWEKILANKELFFSRESILPFIGFARSQAFRAVMKGEHLNLLKDLVRSLKEVPSKTSVSSYFKGSVLAKNEQGKEEGQVEFFGHKLRLFRNEHGFLQLEIAGRPYDPGSKVKMLRLSLETLIEKYGSRVKSAAEHGYDHKSLLHCMRLLGEADEFLKTGRISLPRPPEEVEFLQSIKRKEYPTPDIDIFQEIDSRIRLIETEAVASSTLPLKVNWSAIDKLCVELHTHAFIP